MVDSHPTLADVETLVFLIAIRCWLGIEVETPISLIAVGCWLGIGAEASVLHYMGSSRGLCSPTLEKKGLQ